MSIMDTLTNPWVLGAGAAIGLVLMFSRSGDGGGGGPSAYFSPAFLSEQMRTNAALVQTSLQTGASLEAKRMEFQTTRDIAALSTMAKLADSSAVLSARLTESRNGTLRTLATSNAAVAIDASQNFARLGMTYIQSSTAKYQADTSLAIARVQAKAMKEKGMYDMIGGIANTLGKVAVAAI
jgi:hypothetical protein